MIAPEIRRIEERDIAGFRDAVDRVAREKRFLGNIEGPTIEGATAFVRGNIEKRNPQFVALKGESVIGWCDIVRQDHRPIHAHIGVLGMGLLPGFRGQGLGRRLIDTTIADALALGMTRIALTVRADNEIAIRLYRSVGFETEGLHRRTDRIDGVEYDTYSMARLA